MFELLYPILPKLLTGFIIMLFYIHLSGKGALAPISAIDQVGNVALGAIIGGTLFNDSVNLLEMALAVSLWACLMLGIRFLSNRHMQVKQTVDEEAIRLIENGTLLTDNFSKAGLAVRDFIMLLHQRGYHNIAELSNVWYEYNGQLTVHKKGDKSYAFAVIENGDVNENNLKRIDKDQKWLDAQLKRHKIKLENIFCAEYHNEKLWIYPVNKTKDQAEK